MFFFGSCAERTGGRGGGHLLSVSYVDTTYRSSLAVFCFFGVCVSQPAHQTKKCMKEEEGMKSRFSNLWRKVARDVCGREILRMSEMYH